MKRNPFPGVMKATRKPNALPGFLREYIPSWGYTVLWLGFAIFFGSAGVWADSLLVPMDQAQTNHCRGYGLVYQCLEENFPGITWLLNYRGGAFLLPDSPDIKRRAKVMGVTLEPMAENEVKVILATIQEENMDAVALEKAPRIAIYLPSKDFAKEDVVARTLEYSGIAYQTIYDGEILEDGLSRIDWLHIHHKDFTGTNHRSRSADPYERDLTRSRGFQKVWQMKQMVAAKIADFVEKGGFLFAMCSAAETIDVSLAAQGVDIEPAAFDGDPADPDAQRKLDYSRTFAFGDFVVFTDAGDHYSDIDVPTAGEDTIFKLFPFSATVDPIPCLLNQNHTDEIEGFSGETTSFRRSLLKKDVIILAENNDGVSVRYLAGYRGKGVFSFYGGHSPSEKGVNFLKNAPGFRLILNNVLFPSAKTRRRKT